MSEAKLLVANIAEIASVVSLLAVGIFILTRNWKGQVNITFFLLSLATAVYQFLYLIGVNLNDSELSRATLFYTFLYFFIPSFALHWILTVFGKSKERTVFIVGSYAISVFLASFYLADQTRFLGESLSKLYYPNFYEAGSLIVLSLAWFAVSALVVFTLMLVERRFADSVMRRRMAYFGGGLLLLFVAVLWPFLLALGVPLDPVWGALAGIAVLPLGYALIRYELLNIEAAVKQGALYTGISLGVGLLIIAVNTVTNALAREVPGFPTWVTPIVSGIIMVVLGNMVWRQIRALDRLKYEFVTVVTHKFRTPLTSIKWASENLPSLTVEDERASAVATIKNAGERLERLTDNLVGLSKNEASVYEYRFEEEDLGALVREIVERRYTEMKKRSITPVIDVSSNLPKVRIDRRKLHFVIEMFLENAIAYTPTGGRIGVSLSREANSILFSVRDSGIGITAADRPYVFTKFFRSGDAKRIDTEGLGISLYMSKDIVNRHGGQIGVFSEGAGKGSTFYFKIKI